MEGTCSPLYKSIVYLYPFEVLKSACHKHAGNAYSSKWNSNKKANIWLQFVFFYAVEIKLYAPTRPVVDFSVVFLWLMSVGTVISATLWSEFTATEESDKHYNELSSKVIHYDLSFVCACGFTSISSQGSDMHDCISSSLCLSSFPSLPKSFPFFVLVDLLEFFSQIA